MDTIVFNKGIPSSVLKSKWRNLLLILQKFVTCEGRFGCMFFYHIRILMNLIEEHQMNLPYFLLNILKKMSVSVQKKIQLIDNKMCHHGLVKILIEFHLQSIGDDWEDFLVRNHFEEKTPKQPSGRRTLRGRKRKIEMVIEHEPQHQ